MVYIKSWDTYFPSNRVEVNGKPVPALGRDEDEVTLSFEVLRRLNLTESTHLVFVKDEITNIIDFHIVADLLELPVMTISVYDSIDDALEQALNVLPSVLVVVRAKPPAGSVAIEFGKKGVAEILKYEVRKEFMGFIRTSVTDERAFSDLVSDLTLSHLPSVLRKIIHSRGSKYRGIKVVSGYMYKPKVFQKMISSLGLKNADTSPVTEVLEEGFRGNLAAGLSLIKGLNKCTNSDKMLFMGDVNSGRVFLIFMRCRKR